MSAAGTGRLLGLVQTPALAPQFPAIHLRIPKRSVMKILLIDDHAMFCEGLRLVFERIDTTFEIIDVGDCASAFDAIKRHADLTLVLLDLGLPDMPGLDALSLLREHHPDLPVVVLSATEDRPTVLEAINRGAMGFIPKSSDSSLLVNALRLVLAKGVYVPPSALTKPLNAGDTAPSTSVKQKTAALRELGITERQMEVLGLLLQGLPNKLIAHRMNLSEATVKTHVAACLRVLNVANRTQAVLAVGRLGYTFK